MVTASIMKGLNNERISEWAHFLNLANIQVVLEISEF